MKGAQVHVELAVELRLLLQAHALQGRLVAANGLRGRAVHLGCGDVR